METQTIVCPNCQTPNPARNLYCQSCGKPLAQAAPKPAAQPVEPVEPAEPVSQPGPSQEGQMPAYPDQPQNYPPPAFPPPPPPAQGMPPTQQPGFPPQEPAPQQAYYPPPAPPAPAPSMDAMGARIDGWTDLIPGAASAADEVEQAFIDEINARDIPMVMVEKADFRALTGRKSYQVVRSPLGTIALHVGPAGNDLLLSWSLFTRNRLNLPMLGILAAIAFGISFLTSLGVVYNFGVFFVNWIFGTFQWIFYVSIVALIAGYAWKGSLWYFFIESPGEAAYDELAGLTLAVHQSLCIAVEKAGLPVERLRKFQPGERNRKY